VTAPDNDPRIADEDELLRRIPDSPKMTTSDGKGGIRPTSAALEIRIDRNEIAASVDQRKLLADPDNPGSVREGHPDTWGLATFTAADARIDDKHRVVGDPIDGNAAHTLVHPTATSRKAQKRNFSEIAQRMKWVEDYLPSQAEPT
jgi:hypothetical protein